jgi:hypothetical protein
MSSKQPSSRIPGLRTDPKITELLQGAVENRAALTQKQKRDRSRQKATYDLPPTLQDAISAVAKREDTSSSQIVSIFLSYALDAYVRKDAALVAGMAERTHAATPRFSWNLHTPPAWTAAVESLAAERLPPGWRKK